MILFRLRTLLFFVIGFSLLLSITAFAEHVENELIIKYSKGTSASLKNKTADHYNLTLLQSLRFTNAALYQVDSNISLLETKSSLEKLDHVEFVSLNKILKKQSLDPEFNTQWYLENTGQSINHTYGAPNIDIGWKAAIEKYSKKINTYVAVADSGFAKDHQELSGKEVFSIPEKNGLLFNDDDGNGYVDDVSGWDFVDNDPDPYDFKGHGTQVSGIISSNADGVGVQGIAPDAYIMPLRVLNSEGGGSIFSTVRALEYVYFNPAFRIVNLSLGGYYNDPLIQQIVEAFEQNDFVLLVCAAGNEGLNNDQTPSYPASYDSSSVLSVGSINQNANLSEFSNYGEETVDIVAPGENIRAATVLRTFDSEYKADGLLWRETFWWTDSISTSYTREQYGSHYWLESPDYYNFASTLHSPFIDLRNAKDPRLKIELDYDLKGVGSLFLLGSVDSKNYNLIKSFSPYSVGGYRVEEIDISEFTGGNLQLKFHFSPGSTLSYFDIGRLQVFDVDTGWHGSPYYEYNEGTSFSAPIVSGVAALIMSHRPDLLASDVKEVLMNSVYKLDNLSGKIKSGGMVRADKAIELANTYRKRSSVEFVPTYNQELTSDLKVKINDIYLTVQEMTAGVLDGQGHYFEGDSITLSAVPAVGFNFEGWEENGVIISNDETYTFTSEFKGYIFKAIFSEDLSDPDNDEFPNYAEAIYGTNISDPNSDNDSLNDYDEWQVAWYGSSLDLLQDDSEKISLLEDIIGADMYDQGIAKVLNEPASYSLIPKSVYNQALLDANETAEQAITDAKVASKSEGVLEGKALVTSNPASYSLVTQSVYNQAIESAKKTAREEASKGFQDIFQNQDSNASPYARDWFYMPERGWMWTKPKVFPWLYDKKSSNWMYFQSGHENPRFYHYGTKEWMTLD